MCAKNYYVPKGALALTTKVVSLALQAVQNQMVYALPNYSVRHIGVPQQYPLKRLTSGRAALQDPTVQWIIGGIESVNMLTRLATRTHLRPLEIVRPIAAGSGETDRPTKIGVTPGRRKLLSVSETCGERL
jgi:hypothetical protein